MYIYVMDHGRTTKERRGSSEEIRVKSSSVVLVTLCSLSNGNENCQIATVDAKGRLLVAKMPPRHRNNEQKSGRAERAIL